MYLTERLVTFAFDTKGKKITKNTKGNFPFVFFVIFFPFVSK